MYDLSFHEAQLLEKGTASTEKERDREKKSFAYILVLVTNNFCLTICVVLIFCTMKY